MRPSTSSCSTAADASSTALKAPKAFVTLRASSSMARLGLRGPLPRAARKQGEQSAREEAGDDDNDGAINDERQAGAFAAKQAVGDLLQRHQDQGSHQRPEQQTGPAERRHDQHLDRDEDAEARFRIDEAEHDG